MLSKCTPVLEKRQCPNQKLDALKGELEDTAKEPVNCAQHQQNLN